MPKDLNSRFLEEVVVPQSESKEKEAFVSIDNDLPGLLATLGLDDIGPEGVEKIQEFLKAIDLTNVNEAEVIQNMAILLESVSSSSSFGDGEEEADMVAEAGISAAVGGDCSNECAAGDGDCSILCACIFLKLPPTPSPTPTDDTGCLSGDTGIMKVNEEDNSTTIIPLKSAMPGDMVKGLDSDLEEAICEVVLSGTGMKGSFTETTQLIITFIMVMAQVLVSLRMDLMVMKLSKVSIRFFHRAPLSPMKAVDSLLLLILLCGLSITALSSLRGKITSMFTKFSMFL